MTVIAPSFFRIPVVAAFQQADVPDLSSVAASSWMELAATAGGTIAAASTLTVGGLFAYRWLTRGHQRPENAKVKVSLALLALLTSATLHLVGAESEEIGRQTLRLIDAAHNLHWGLGGRSGGGGVSLASVRRSLISGAEPLVLGDPQLIAEAQESLRRWRATGELGDLSGFIVRTSMRRREPAPSAEWRADFLTGWNGYLEEQVSLRIDGPIENVAAASSLLGHFQSRIASDFPYYQIDQPDMTRLYEDRRGNCEARAFLMGAAFSDVVPRLPSHLVLTMELFSRHIQPVLYDRNAEESWDLWTGEIRGENKGDLYHAAIVYHSFLEAQGAESPVTEEELLITMARHPDREPDNAASEPLPNWSSAFRFPASDTYFNAVPAESAPPETTTPGEASETASEGEADHAADVERLRSRLQEASWEFELLDNGYGQEPEIVFRTLAEQEHYEALESPEARRDYLLSLFRDSLRRFAGTEDFSSLSGLMDDPCNRLPQATQEEVESAAATARDYRNLLGTNLAIIRYLHGTPEEGADLGHSLHEAILRQFPDCRRLERLESAFATSLMGDPGAFFLMLDQAAGYERKRAIVEFVSSVSPNGQYPQETLERFLLDPNRIDMAGETGEETPYRAPRMEDWMIGELLEGGEMIEIEVISGSLPLETGNISQSAEISETVPEAEDTPEPAPTTPARVLVTPETLIDAILVFRSGQDEEGEPLNIVQRRWSRALASAYRGISTGEERDRAFVSEARLILQRSLSQEESDRFEERLSNLGPSEDYRRWFWRLLIPHLGNLPAPMRGTLGEIRRRRGDDFVVSGGDGSGAVAGPGLGWRTIEAWITERYENQDR